VQCLICGRIFQNAARTIVCCGLVMSLASGHGPRPQPVTAEQLREQVLRTSTSTAVVSGASTSLPFESTKGSG
jgi:hypothetical protein